MAAEPISRDSQSRKWLLTMNNPDKHGFSHAVIKEILSGMKSVVYWCMADEIGNKTGTYHTHIFIYSTGGIRFSTLKKKFPPADLEMSRGTAVQNVAYVSKTGKWLGDPKEDTSVDGSFEEFGTCPIERPGARNDIADLYTMVKSGMSDYEILEDMPDALAHIDRLEKVRQIIHQEQFKNIRRELTVTYIFGAPGTGKTRSVMDQYGYSNVYRVTDYFHPFDGYKGQDVLVFEEFRSSLPLTSMLTYLDGYPLDLPCRYSNKMACYTHVYLITNIPLRDQYEDNRRTSYDSWLAFIRRIHAVIQYTQDEILYYDVEMTRNDFHLLPCSPLVKRTSQ